MLARSRSIESRFRNILVKKNNSRDFLACMCRGGGLAQ
jgi:hypothetical protein